MSHKIFRLLLVAILMIGLVVVEQPLVVRAAGPWYVSNAGDDNNDCLNPGTACATINAALGKASSSDTIYVAVGTYTNTGTGFGSEVARILKSVTLSGGWDATFTTQSGMSTIDGEGLSDHNGIYTSDFADPNITVSIDHFTVTNASQGIHNGVRSALTVSNSTIFANLSVGIHVTAVSLTLNDSGVVGNNGEGIHIDGGNVVLNNSIISGNHESGIYVGNSTVSLNNSAVRDNIASSGGGISMSPFGILDINNSTIANNTSPVGGGLYLPGGATLNINNSTISGNTASSSGGGIALGLTYGPNTVALQNSILANNISATGPDCSGTIDASNHNILGDTTGCTVTAGAGDQFDVNPRTSPYPVGASGYFTILADSPAVDTGDPATCLPTDQRGMTRPQGSVCDIGAYEYVASPGAATSFGYLSGTNQRATPGAVFLSPFVVYTLDDNGSAVPGVSVTFAAPSSGPSGTFTDTGTNLTTVLSDSSGVAISSAFTANNEPGIYEVIATASGLADSVPFALTNAAWFVATTGNDGNDCLSPSTPCATINGAIGKATSGDTVNVAEGNYPGSGSEVVLIDKSITLAGGWDSSFSAQNAMSTIDGENLRRGLTLNNGVSASVDRFTMQFGNVTGNGGGIYNAGSLTVTHSIISNNTSGSGTGGAIYNTETGMLAINNSIIRLNGSDQMCWALANYGILNIDNSIVEDNTSSTRYCAQLTLMNGSGTMTLTETIVRNNLGGIYNYASAILKNSVISGNAGGDGPGGIYNWGGSLVVINSTISGNATSSGGGIFTGGGGIVKLNNATLSANTASTGGGIYNHPSSPSEVLMQNTILAGNTASTGADCNGTIGSLGYNLVGNTSDCGFTATTGDLSNLDAKLGMLVGSPAYHPLMSDSPAIDAGNPAGCIDQDGNPLPTDQRGVARVGICDIGAYEYTTPGPATNLMVLSGDAQSTVTTFPFPDPLQVTVLDGQGSPVEGVTINFIAPETGPSGTFADTSTNTTLVISDGSGVGTTSVFTANDQLGIYAVSASSAGLGSVVFNLQQIERPLNDNIAEAEIISTLPFSDSVDTTNATLELNEPAYCGSTNQTRSVWYSFTPATNMVVSADMFGSSFSDTNLTVFRSLGPGFGGLSFLRSACSGNSMTFDVQAGTTYYLQAENYDSSGGDLHLNLQQLPPPANDSFANADVITSLPFSATVDMVAATTEPDEPFNCSYSIRSVWYVFMPTENTAIRLDMTGSQVGGAVSIYRATGPSIANLSHVTCSYSGSLTNIQLAAGEIYYVQIISNEPGILQFHLEPITPPANDNFASAEEILALPFSAAVDLTNATAESGEPPACAYQYRSVWYKFTPAEDMAVQLSISSNQGGGLVGIFSSSGSDISGLSNLGCAYNIRSANLQLEAGQTYYLRVDAYLLEPLQLNLQQINPPENDGFANSAEILSLPFSATVDNTNATAEMDESSVCGFPFRSVWYVFTPSETMTTRIRYTSQVYGAVDIFRADGPGIADLTFMACASNGGTTNLQLEAGATYYFRMDSNGEPGNIQLDLEKIFPPGNDNFANAEEIGSLPFNVSVNNSDATIEPGEPLGCGFQYRSIWYKFTPTENVIVRANTAGSAASGLIEIYLATGTEISDLTFLGCAGSSSIHLPLEAGSTYYLRIDAFGQGGIIQVNMEESNPPDNDNLANAETVTILPFSASPDVTDSTSEPNEPQYCYFMSNTVWYSFTPTENMTVRANTLGGSLQGNVNIFSSTGTGFSDLQFLQCSGPTGSPSFLAEAGKTYYLQAGPISGSVGTIRVNLYQAVPPSNDNFTNSDIVTALPFSATTNISDATNEPSESQYCYFMERTVWYSFTPAETVKMRLDTIGSAINANVNIYQAAGSGISELQFINCSGPFSTLAFIAEAGQTYYFQVGAAYVETGNIQLNLAEVPVLSGRLTDAATGAPLPGNTEPFALVTLFRVCGDSCLEFVNSQNADGEGRFLFDSYYFGTPLSAGTYQIEASANLYQMRQFGPFEFTGSSLDVGDLALDPLVTQVMHVDIDVVPGTSTNVIYSNVPLITVAILSADGFDAVNDVDRSSLTFGKTGDEASLSRCLAKQRRDVNGDGRPDLVCYFSFGMTGLVLGDTQAILRGQTMSGTAFEGMDSVKVAPGSKHR